MKYGNRIECVGRSLVGSGPRCDGIPARFQFGTSCACTQLSCDSECAPVVRCVVARGDTGGDPLSLPYLGWKIGFGFLSIPWKEANRW